MRGRRKEREKRGEKQADTRRGEFFWKREGEGRDRKRVERQGYFVCLKNFNYHFSHWGQSDMQFIKLREVPVISNNSLGFVIFC